MNKPLIILGLSGLLLTLGNCDRPSRQASDQMALDAGRGIATATFQTLSSQLSGAIEEGGIPHALEFCSVEAMPLTDELSERYNVSIRRATHQPRNPENRANEAELQVIEEYIDAIESGEDLTPRLVREEEQILFFSPIRIGMDLCLQCHGSPESDIEKNNLELIRSLYPEDEATGFSMGELRGIWSITLPSDSVSIRMILDRVE